jgi:uncharacterized protein
VRRTLVWQGLDEPRMEIARVEVTPDGLVAEGTQIGLCYELRYELEPGRLRMQLVGGGATLDTGLDGRDFFDLAYSPLFNTLPILGRLEEPRDFVMTFVDVPSLEVSRSEQRYEPLRDGVVRFRSGSFTAEIEFDADGFVTHYEGLAERVG